MNNQTKLIADSFGRGLALTSEARAALRLRPVLREVEWTTSQTILLGMLQARGLLVPSSALEIEAAIGGALMASGRHMGIFASLRQLERQGPLIDGESDFPNRQMRTSDKQLLRSESGPMLPLVVDTDPELWLNCDGAVYLANRDDDYGYHVRAFDTFARYVEVFALLREAIIWPPEHMAPPIHRLFTSSLVGGRLAAALGAWPVDETSGLSSRVWVRDELHVVEIALDGFVIGTHVGAADVNGAIEGLAALDPRSNNVEWQCPVNAPGQTWSAAGLPRPTRTFEHARSTIHSWGSVEGYGFEMKRRRFEAGRAR